MNIGKWLVLFAQGRLDQMSAQQDIKDYVAANPTGVDSDRAQQVASAFFTTQMQRPPNEEEGSILQQWVNLVVAPVPEGQLEQEQGLENELPI